MPPLKNLRGLLLLPLAMLAGCNTVVLNASGDIARQQGNLIVISTVLMLLIIVPVLALIAFFSWKYRQSNKEANYSPEWDHSTELELAIWAAPLLIIIALGAITWISTHTLDPYRPLRRIDVQRPVPEGTKPLTVEVVALDWKWLFIYPEQGIATVNELAAPVDRPITFKITASSVMNSFFIPALAGQIYAMPAMETKLNAVINEPGEFEGFSANYSGAGFSGMRFKFHGLSDTDFDQWVKKTKAGGGELTREGYIELERPSERDPVRRFAAVAPDLYDAILNRCVDRNKMCMKQMMAIDASGGLSGPVGAYNITTKPWQADQKNSPIRTYVTAMCTVDDPAGMSVPRSNLRIQE
jgi:cytochrome o ubiquinol oxidase subunit II